MFHPEGPTFWELAHQAMSATERGYDLLAPKFDHTPFRTEDGVLQASLALLGEVDDALDVCCGTGAATTLWRPLARRRLVGLDFSAGMLAEAERRYPNVAIEWLRGDALEMTFDAEFDAAVCFGAIGHFRRHEQPVLLARVAAALRPGGRFLMISHDPPKFWSTAHLLSLGFNVSMRLRNLVWRPAFHMYYLNFMLPQALKLMEAAGFRVDMHRDVLPEPWRSLTVLVGHKE